MRFAALGSGSRGNAMVVEAGATRVLLDCGFGIGETVGRLARLGLAPEQLSGIVVTHEHDDHSGGVARFARKFGLPLWSSYGTWQAALCEFSDLKVNLLDGHRRCAIGDLELEPYVVPHDAREPLQFVFGDGARRLGILTDTGCVTPHIVAALHRCDALVLECNHDPELLRTGAYPPALKQRIAGRYGHLANDAAAGLLADLDCSGLQHIVGAHLSQQNNKPELARSALAQALNCAEEWIAIADQERGFAWREIS